jgi:hypothetical protein
MSVAAMPPVTRLDWPVRPLPPLMSFIGFRSRTLNNERVCTVFLNRRNCLRQCANTLLINLNSRPRTFASDEQRVVNARCICSRGKFKFSAVRALSVSPSSTGEFGCHRIFTRVAPMFLAARARFNRAAASAADFYPHPTRGLRLAFWKCTSMRQET